MTFYKKKRDKVKTSRQKINPKDNDQFLKDRINYIII